MTAPTPTPAAGGPAPDPATGTPGTPGTADTPGAPAPRPTTTAATTTAAGSTPAEVWRRARGFLIALAVLLTAAVTLAALSSGTHHGRLDPRSPAPEGSRAVAELLRARGVTTRVVTTADEAAEAAGPGTTLLVTDPDLLGDRQLRSIRSAIDLSGGRTVLLAPGDPALADLAPAVHTAGKAHERTLASGCALPAATVAGPADTGDGRRYDTTAPGATGCYPSGGHPTVLLLPTSTTGSDTVVLGSAHVLLNEDLAREGNASLALQLLGTRTDLVWYLPSLAELGEGDTEEKSFLSLIPAGWHWALLQLFLAAALAALWRARRLGPLVTERLPVAVRASEATEGRARLYRKTDARDRAASVLRAATRERLAALVGVPSAHTHDPAVLVPAVAARLTDPGRDLTALLFGTAPADGAALVALADHLDALEREVRTS
ncbi:DUF4350 domain-containing protein [Streptomyces sp. NPDC101206]|uniref:DUF4350 domain-containing protein n=1 Tax=Streptomyces sp. NPDC101206 TaxID=3366128 RepID=UPI003819BB81